MCADGHLDDEQANGWRTIAQTSELSIHVKTDNSKTTDNACNSNKLLRQA
jgi:hypothetical protein